ncbi:hypothetical protein [Bradyrhizobium sp.]
MLPRSRSPKRRWCSTRCAVPMTR